MSTHVKSYYASTDYLMLLERLQTDLAGRRISLASISGKTERDGAFWDYEKRIFLGRLTAVLGAGTRRRPPVSSLIETAETPSHAALGDFTSANDFFGCAS
jgi:hypothetical protein